MTPKTPSSTAMVCGSWVAVLPSNGLAVLAVVADPVPAPMTSALSAASPGIGLVTAPPLVTVVMIVVITATVVTVVTIAVTIVTAVIVDMIAVMIAMTVTANVIVVLARVLVPAAQLVLVALSDPAARSGISEFSCLLFPFSDALLIALPVRPVPARRSASKF